MTLPKLMGSNFYFSWKIHDMKMKRKSITCPKISWCCMADTNDTFKNLKDKIQKIKKHGVDSDKEGSDCRSYEVPCWHWPVVRMQKSEEETDEKPWMPTYLQTTGKWYSECPWPLTCLGTDQNFVTLNWCTSALCTILSALWNCLQMSASILSLEAISGRQGSWISNATASNQLSVSFTVLFLSKNIILTGKSTSKVSQAAWRTGRVGYMGPPGAVKE